MHENSTLVYDKGSVINTREGSFQGQWVDLMVKEKAVAGAEVPLRMQAGTGSDRLV